MAGQDGLSTPRLPPHVRHYVDITPVLVSELPHKNVNDQLTTVGTGAGGASGRALQDSNKEMFAPDGLNVYWTVDHRDTRHRRRAEGEGLTRHYPTMSGQTEQSVYSLCVATVLNSSLSTLCAPYIQDKLHLPLDICVLDVTMMDDPGWAQFSLPLVEMLCEAEVSRDQLGWDINYKGQLVPPSHIATALNCPDNCSGHGECQADRCHCRPGYSSHDCSHLDGQIKRSIYSECNLAFQSSIPHQHHSQ